VAGQPNTFGRGPLGVPTNSPISDLGTSARIQNRPNVPIGTESTAHHTQRKSTAQLRRNREQRTLQLPDLQVGTRGKYVERLQRLLNSHLDGKPDLKVDGAFGPKTRTAVVQFQKSSELTPDGIVGRRTWFALITQESEDSGPSPKTPSGPGSPSGAALASAATASSAETPLAPAPPKERSVDEWSLYERFEYVVLHTGSHLKGNLGDQFAALVTTTGLKYVVGALVVWGVSQFLGIGEVLDAALLLYAGFSAGHHLGTFILLTCTASTKKELDDAANNLAEAIEILGVIAFFALLSRVARILRAKVRGAGESEGGPPPKEEPPPAPKAQPKPKTEPSSSEKPAEGDAPPEKSAREKLAERRELARQAKLKKDVADAESAGKLDKLDPADRDWLNEDPTGRRKELAYDPDTKSFKPNEARAALRAEQDGTLKAPVKRAYSDDGSSGGADYVDGDGTPWDVKDASAGADSIAEVAAPKGGQPGENVLVDCSNMSAADQQALQADIASRPSPPGTGQVTFVPKRN